MGLVRQGSNSTNQTPGLVKLIERNGRALEQHGNTIIDGIHDLAVIGHQGLFERLGQYGAVPVRESAFTDRCIDLLEVVGPQHTQAFMCHGTAEN